MKKALKKCFALIFAFTFVFLIFAMPASAASYTPREFTLSSVKDKNLYSYTSRDIIYNGAKLSEQARIINSVVYLPLRAFASATVPGAAISYNSTTRTMTVTASGLKLTATDGAYVVHANDRPLFALTPVTILSNGRMYIPADTLVKVLGLSYTSSGSRINVSGGYRPLMHADKFYRSDEVLWLARIISAESRGESLLGQIAVGNVVLNRVKSKDFPNTIYGVIFDRKYGVQFTPVMDGTIYNTPGYTETLAAKICLEGVNLSPDILFFLAPSKSTSFWIVNTRKYAFTIGGHDFFK